MANKHKIQCHYCKKYFWYLELTKDHVVPQAIGGRNINENVVPCCRACNNRKADKFPTCQCGFCKNAVAIYRKQWTGMSLIPDHIMVRARATR